MTTKEKIWVGGIAVALICGLVLVVTIFLPNYKEDKYFDLLLKEKDKQIEREREIQVDIVKRFEPLIEDSRRKDSLLAIKSKVNTIRYEAVPSVVNAIPDNELLRKLRERYPDSDPN